MCAIQSEKNPVSYLDGRWFGGTQNLGKKENGISKGDVLVAAEGGFVTPS